MLPTVEDHRPRQGPDILEKGLASRQDLAQQCIFCIAPLQDGMEQKGNQVKAEHYRREVLLAMPKVVCDMVALRLEHIVVFVFDLPPPTACLRYLCNVSNSNFNLLRGLGLSIDTDLAKVENSEYQGGNNDEPLKFR